LIGLLLQVMRCDYVQLAKKELRWDIDFITNTWQKKS
jgi:hypothetical protein